MRRTAGRILVSILIATVIVGCARRIERRLVVPNAVDLLDPALAPLKAHLRDGRLYVFESWTVDEQARTVTGHGTAWDVHRREFPAGPLSVSVDSVAVFETNRIVTSSTVGFLTLVTGFSLAGTAACIANPKACFGSCPTFYVTDGTGPRLMAEGFSAAIAPSLESTDLDALYRAAPRGRRVELVMTNEALETHVVRHADLLVAPRAPGTRVFATPDRRFFTARDPRPPRSALGPEGDCAAALAAFDGVERTSLTDSTDLAAREELVLVFDAPAANTLGLVLATRQSLLSTYVLYQALAWMGTSAGDWLARLERGDPAVRSRVTGVADRLGRIEAEVLRDGAWMPIGGVREPGPLATDVVVLPFAGASQGECIIRLRLTRGMYRIDWAALATVDGPATALRIPPASVARTSRPDDDLRRLLVDPDSVLVTVAGDTCRIAYDLPCDAADCELFLESRGYYWEWIREPWLAEENPVALARLFLDPERTLRELAPHFKEVEPGMEAAFWGSRYARP